MHIYPLVRVATDIVMFSCEYPPTTESYTLSLHDALPIFAATLGATEACAAYRRLAETLLGQLAALENVELCFTPQDRKSTRLNSSHTVISYAVFCLKKKIQDEPAGHANGRAHRSYAGSHP